MPRVASVAAQLIGKRIVEIRLRAGLTQDQLAVRSGIDSANIRAFESGRTTPSVPSLIKVAYALDVPAGDLLQDVTLESLGEPRRRTRGAA